MTLVWLCVGLARAEGDKAGNTYQFAPVDQLPDNAMMPDPRGSWLALVEASKVWALFGKARAIQTDMPLENDILLSGPIAYHIRDGGHALTTFDWKLYLDHADTLFKKEGR